MREELSIKRPMKICTDSCIQGVKDSVHHNLRTLEILDENGSYQRSEGLRIQMMEKLSDELYKDECIVDYELYKSRGKYER